MDGGHATTRPEVTGNNPLSDLLPNMRTLSAGLAGLIAWEVFARVIAPFWIGGPLDASGLIQAALGVESGTLAFVVHVLTALVAFPIAYVVVVEPLVRRIMPGLPWLVVGAGYGVGLWAFAMIVIAYGLAGFPLFLGFQPVAWASLVGHVALALAMTGTLAFMPRPTAGRA